MQDTQNCSAHASTTESSEKHASTRSWRDELTPEFSQKPS